MWLVWPGKTFERGNMSCNAINMKEPTMQGSGKWIPEGFWAMGKVERRTNLIGLPWAAKKRVSGFEGWGLIPFLVLVSFHWVMLFFLLLVCYWHLWIILKLNSPFLLKWLWREFLGCFFFFFHLEELELPLIPTFLEQQLTTEYPGKGKNVQNKEREYSAAAQPLGTKKKRELRQVWAWDHFMKNSGLKGGRKILFTFCFLSVAAEFKPGSL